MLYQDPSANRLDQFRRSAAKFLVSLQFARRRHAELDLMTMSPHLKRDLGLNDSGLSELIGR
jgi:hypothetical protein